MKAHIYKQQYVHEKCISIEMQGKHLREVDMLLRKALKKTCQVCNQPLVDTIENSKVKNEISPGQVKKKKSSKKESGPKKRKKTSKKSKKQTTTEIHFEARKRHEKKKAKEMSEIQKRLENEIGNNKIENILENIGAIIKVKDDNAS